MAILGAGTIAQSAHLPAYEQHGVGVTGVWSRTPATTATVRERFPFVGRVYASAEELLADPEVRYVDLATGPEGRLDWIEAAVEAGKHVLAQKPLTLSAADLDRLPAVLGARRRGGRAGRGQPQRPVGAAVAGGDPAGPRGRGRRGRRRHPPARQAAAAAGRHAVRRRAAHAAHRLPPALGRHHPHLAGRRRRRSRCVSVQAADSRVPGQPAEARNPWSATLSMTAATGATADAADRRQRGRPPSPAARSGCTAPTGTLRGSVLLDSDRLELDDGADRARPCRCAGAWFVDGFAAAMGELMCAVAEDRQPENSAADAARVGRGWCWPPASPPSAAGAPVEVGP